MSKNLIERLNKGPVICAEGFLFEIERRGYMSSGEFVPMVSLEHPKALETLHKDFQHAGSDIVEAFTYNGHREKMKVIGKEELIEPLNRAALKIARKVANLKSTGPKPNLMAGNISNSNIWNDKDKKTHLQVEKMFNEMIGWAVDEGADMLIGETYYYAEEAFKALEIMKKTKLPTVVTIAPMAEDVMRDGYGIVETCKELEQRGADVVGMNCFRGPATMLPYIQKIRKQVKCHVGALPIPVRTNKKHSTWFNLPDRKDCACSAPHGRTFPTALEPLLCNRYEIGHSVGLTVPASKYREKMENHFMYGKGIPKHMKNYGNKA